MSTVQKKRKLAPGASRRHFPRVFLIIAGIVLALLVLLFLVFVSV